MKNTLGNTIGASLLGVIAASILFGITVVQVYIYYHNYPKDWRFQKIAVAFLLGLDVLHVVFAILAIYQYLIDEFGDLKAVQYLTWAFKVQVVFNVAIVLVIQALYAWRVWMLGRNFSKIWPSFIVLLVAGGWGLGIVLTVKILGTRTFDGVHKMEDVLQASFIFATTIDFSIAIAICYTLKSSQTSFRGTNNMLLRIMRYVLVCGFLTSTCSLTAMITYATMPLNLIFLGIDFLLPHIYINSYLALLNARNGHEVSTSSFVVSNVISKIKFQTRQPEQSESTFENKTDQLQTDSIGLSNRV